MAGGLRVNVGIIVGLAVGATLIVAVGTDVAV